METVCFFKTLVSTYESIKAKEVEAVRPYATEALGWRAV
jgi:hypothetical protein